MGCGVAVTQQWGLRVGMEQPEEGLVLSSVTGAVSLCPERDLSRPPRDAAGSGSVQRGGGCSASSAGRLVLNAVTHKCHLSSSVHSV